MKTNFDNLKFTLSLAQNQILEQIREDRKKALWNNLKSRASIDQNRYSLKFPEPITQMIISGDTNISKLRYKFKQTADVKVNDFSMMADYSCKFIQKTPIVIPEVVINRRKLNAFN